MQLARPSLRTISSSACIRLVGKEMLTSNAQERKEGSRDKKLRNANRNKRPKLRNPAQQVAVTDSQAQPNMWNVKIKDDYNVHLFCSLHEKQNAVNNE